MVSSGRGGDTERGGRHGSGHQVLGEVMKTAVLFTSVVKDSLRHVIVGGRYSMLAGRGDAPAPVGD